MFYGRCEQKHRRRLSTDDPLFQIFETATNFSTQENWQDCVCALRRVVARFGSQFGPNPRGWACVREEQIDIRQLSNLGCCCTPLLHHSSQISWLAAASTGLFFGCDYFPIIVTAPRTECSFAHHLLVWFTPWQTLFSDPRTDPRRGQPFVLCAPIRLWQMCDGADSRGCLFWPELVPAVLALELAMSNYNEAYVTWSIYNLIWLISECTDPSLLWESDPQRWVVETAKRMSLTSAWPCKGLISLRRLIKAVFFRLALYGRTSTIRLQ